MWENHSERIAELEAGAPEASFEELRELKAYPPPSNPRTLRIIGGAMFMLGAGLIAIYVL